MQIDQLRGEDNVALTRAADAVVALLQDPNHSFRCRQSAEQIYSLDAGVAAYREIYWDLLSPQTAMHSGSL